jgi:hypothetical protein
MRKYLSETKGYLSGTPRNEEGCIFEDIPGEKNLVKANVKHNFGSVEVRVFVVSEEQFAKLDSMSLTEVPSATVEP